MSTLLRPRSAIDMPSNSMRIVTRRAPTIFVPKLTQTSGGGGSFTPEDDPDLVGWFEPRLEEGLANGDAMSTITQRTSSGLANATSSGSNRGTYQTGIQNGLAALLLNGTSQYYTLSTGIPPSWASNAPLSALVGMNLQDKGGGSQFHTLICTATNTSNGGSNKVSFALTAIESNATYGDLWNSFPATGVTTGVNCSPGALPGSACIVGTSYNGSGSSTASNYEMRKDNAAQTETASGTGSTTTDASFLFAWVGVGTPSLYAKGHIFFVYLRNSAFTSQMWSNYAGYLGPLWDISQAAMLMPNLAQDPRNRIFVPRETFQGYGFDEEMQLVVKKPEPTVLQRVSRSAGAATRFVASVPGRVAVAPHNFLYATIDRASHWELNRRRYFSAAAAAAGTAAYFAWRLAA